MVGHPEAIRMVLLLGKVSDRKKAAWYTWLCWCTKDTAAHACLVPSQLGNTISPLPPCIWTNGIFSLSPTGTLPTFIAFCPKGLTFYFISSDILHLINHVIIKCHLVILLLRPSAPLKSHCVTDTWKHCGCPGWLRGGTGGLNSTVIIFFA